MLKNPAGMSPGGLYVYDCTVDVQSSTIARNPSCGILFGEYGGHEDSLTVTNSIIANNTIDCCLTSTSRSFDDSLDSDDCCELSAAAGGLPGTDPLLLPLRNWGGPIDTIDSRPGESPVIDSGSIGGDCPATDQRSVTRPVDGDGDQVATCDMGAVEGDREIHEAFESRPEGEFKTMELVYTRVR